MTPRISAFALAALLTVGATPAAPQSATAWKGLGFVTIDGGVQVTSTSETSTVRYKVYGEDASMNVDYKTDAGPVFGARGGIRVWRRLVLGAGVTRFTDSTAPAVDAHLPHPFFFQRPRSIEGTADAVTREELAVYAEVGWVVPIHPKMDLTLFAGPAFFDVKQELASKPLYSESYPFDAASFQGIQSSVHKKRATGLTVGADFAYRFTTHVGVGGLLRYSQASVKFNPVPEQSVTVDVGGLQVAAGVRFRF
jgi:hypothetical protein